MAQPLTGIKVVDLTTLLPGPLATLMLAEAGAQVIKIERPGGDEMRGFAPLWRGTGAAFQLLNRGKTLTTLDLKSPEGAASLRALLAEADVLVEQFRPGTLERLGFAPAALLADFPRLIVCSISGYGQSGPRAKEAGHDLNYIGNAGLLAIQPGPPDRPVVPPAQIADIGGGSFPAVINILLALRQRDLSGKGCHIDIAMTDAMFTFAWLALAQRWATGAPASGGLLLTGGSPRYRLYPARDGRLIACAALEDAFWTRFANAIGLAPELADDKRDPHATGEAVAASIASRSSAEWEPIFAAADCCVTVVRSLEEALDDPHFIRRGLLPPSFSPETDASLPRLPLPFAVQFRSDE